MDIKPRRNSFSAIPDILDNTADVRINDTREVIKSRCSTLIPYHLRGSLVSIRGVVISIRRNNPFVKSKHPARQRLLLLSPVDVGGLLYDHCWINGNTKLSHVCVGDEISFFSKLTTYEHEDCIKWRPRFPYKYLKVTKGTIE